MFSKVVFLLHVGLLSKKERLSLFDSRANCIQKKVIFLVNFQSWMTNLNRLLEDESSDLWVSPPDSLDSSSAHGLCAKDQGFHQLAPWANTGKDGEETSR